MAVAIHDRGQSKAFTHSIAVTFPRFERYTVSGAKSFAASATSGITDS
jgi:hypothetical protein